VVYLEMKSSLETMSFEAIAPLRRKDYRGVPRNEKLTRDNVR